MGTSKNKKAQFPTNPVITGDDPERKSKGKTTAKAKGLIYTKNVPDAQRYPSVLRDDTHMAKEEISFLEIGKSVPTHAYDVGGKWKLLYKKPGDDDDDKPKGPGIKPRSKSKSPPPKKAKPTQKHSPKPSPKPSVPPKSPQPTKSKEKHSPKSSPKHSAPPKPIKRDDMKIKVKAPDGRTVTLTVKPLDSVDDIKEQVNRRLSIPVEDQRPTFKGKALPDKTTLRENNIVHGDTIDLEPIEISPPAIKPKLAAAAPPTKPKKSSYLPPDWKKRQDKYGTVTVTTYKTRYDVEPDESFIDGEVSKVTNKFKLEKPVLKSEKLIVETVK